MFQMVASNLNFFYGAPAQIEAALQRLGSDPRRNVFPLESLTLNWRFTSATISPAAWPTDFMVLGDQNTFSLLAAQVDWPLEN